MSVQIGRHHTGSRLHSNESDSEDGAEKEGLYYFFSGFSVYCVRWLPSIAYAVRWKAICRARKSNLANLIFGIGTLFRM